MFFLPRRLSIATTEDYFSTFRELTDNAIVVLIKTAEIAQKGIIHNFSVPDLARDSEYDPKHFYNGIRVLEKKGIGFWRADQWVIPAMAGMFQKGGAGCFVVPQEVAEDRFLRETTLKEKRLVLYLLFNRLADGRRKQKTLKRKKELIKEITGAKSFTELDAMFTKLSWLFNVSIENDSYIFAWNKDMLCYPTKTKSIFACKKAVKKILSRYKLPTGKIADFDLRDIVYLWHLYGGARLHQALKIVQEYLARKKVLIESLPAYLHGIIKYSI